MWDKQRSMASMALLGALAACAGFASTGCEAQVDAATADRYPTRDLNPVSRQWLATVAPATLPAPDSSDTYVYAGVSRDGFVGEGFFVKFSDGGKIFFYSSPEDNPHDIANLKRKLAAVWKVGGSFKYGEPQEADMYLATKIELGQEGFAPTPEQIRAMAKMAIARGKHETVLAVPYRAVGFSQNADLPFACKNIKGFLPLTQTTGGSVYVFTVTFETGDALSIVEDARLESAVNQLETKRQEIEACKDSDQVIVAKDMQFHKEFFTLDGTRSGWSAFRSNVSFETADVIADVVE